MISKLTNIIIPAYQLNYNIERNKNIIQASLSRNIKLPFSFSQVFVAHVKPKC